MTKVTLNLSNTFTYRIPYACYGFRVYDTDGDLQKIYIRLGFDEAFRYPLTLVQELTLQRPTTELYLINTEAQSGRYLTIYILTGPLDLVLAHQTAPTKALSLRTGTVTVGTSVVQGPNIKAAPGRAVALLADTSNTGTVYIGQDSTVDTASGWPLSAGDTLQLLIDNLDSVWFIADTAGQTIRYIVEVIS